MHTLRAFSGDNLAWCLKNDFTTPEDIQDKQHFVYLAKYLQDIDAKTMVVEHEYISRDFLHDFTSYYSLCFAEYPKVCKRIHFFSLAFNEEIFGGLVLGEHLETDYKGSYLGFIVVRPIPHTVVGFTVLKTYPDSTERTYWGVKNYYVNLFGIQLSVKSLAFQEQDTVVAACATAAIWSMLHGAVQNCNHTIVLKSPSEITKDAGNSSDGNRLFPNRGLEISQICESIFKAGLVSEIKSGSVEGVTAEYLKKFLNAYSATGIPIIVVLKIADEKTHGYHAITACGFYKKSVEAVEVMDEMSFMAQNITKFYAHDDQWGPFAKILFKEDDSYSLITPWNEDDPENSVVTIDSIIVSVYPKIRISYEEIEVIVRGYDFILSNFMNERLTFDLVWDIRLILNKEYKDFLKTLDPSDHSNKLDLLTSSCPKYIWMASCYVDKDRILEFSFDATGVNQAMLGLHVISHLSERMNSNIVKYFSANINEEALNMFKSPSSTKYCEFLIEQLSPSDSSS